MVVFGGYPPAITVINHSGMDLTIDAGFNVAILPNNDVPHMVPYKRTVNSVKVTADGGKSWSYPPLLPSDYNYTPNDCFQIEPNGSLYRVSNGWLAEKKDSPLVELPPQPPGFPLRPTNP